MSKKIVNKIAPISEERYIRERARKLPIVKCLISQDLEEIGMKSSMVVRQMANGNFVIGTYMIDLYCLGVKETFYLQNASESQFDDLVEHFSMAHNKMVEIPYVELHNLIYGAVAYAEDLGFRPHKDWATSQYILEDDTEDVELIEFEYGFNGKPLYVVGPYDNSTQIIDTLKKSVGEGNFAVENPEDDFMDFDDDDDILGAEDLMEEAELIGFTGEQLEWFAHDISYSAIPDPMMDSIEEKDADLFEEIFESILDAPQQNIPKIEKLIKKYPDFPKSYNFLINSYRLIEDEAKADELLELTLQKFPDYFYVKTLVALKYLNEFEPEKMLKEAFGGAKSLVELYPDSEVFHSNEFANFYFFMMLYYLQQGDKELAKKIIELLEEVVPDERVTQDARKRFDIESSQEINSSLMAAMKMLLNKVPKTRKKKK